MSELLSSLFFKSEKSERTKERIPNPGQKTVFGQRNFLCSLQSHVALSLYKRDKGRNEMAGQIGGQYK